MGQTLVEALDDRGGAAGRLLGLREADDHAKADEERQHEHGADGQSLDGGDSQLQQLAHESRSGRAGFGAGTR